MRTCSVCGRKISKRDICNKCYKTYGTPKWVKELILIQRHFERSRANKELVFTDDNRDIYGEKVIMGH